MEWTQFALCILLGALAVADYKKREIPLWPVAAVLCIGILNLHMQHYRDWKNVLGGIGVGAVLLLLSKATSGRIGAGGRTCFYGSRNICGIKIHTSLYMRSVFSCILWRAFFTLREKGGQRS